MHSLASPHSLSPILTISYSGLVAQRQIAGSSPRVVSHIIMIALVICLLIQSAEAALVASFTLYPGLKVPAGEYVTVDANGSMADGGEHIVTYEWQTNSPYIYDGQPVESVPFVTNAVGIDHSFLPQTIGAQRVTLRIKDSADNIAMVQQTILVEPMISPTADAGGPYYTQYGTSLNLDGTGSFDLDASFGDSIVSYQWMLNSPYNILATGARPTVNWQSLVNSIRATGQSETDNQPFELMLKVTDTTGRSHTDLTSLQIVPEPSLLSLIALGVIPLLHRRR